jgi:hypothetical protein
LPGDGYLRRRHSAGPAARAPTSQRPEFNIRGIRRADLVPFLRQISPASITRQLWRLRQFGLIKKVVHGYRYYLTRLGRSTIAAACRITEQTIVPALAHATP